MTPTAELRVLLLGPLRHDLQREQCAIAYPVDGSQTAFWTEFFRQFPQCQGRYPQLRLARADEFLSPDEKLHPGDEIALIPPVSGG